MLRNKSQNNRLYKLLSDLNVDNEVKEELVHQFTGGRTSHSSAMLINECQALINHLQVLKNQRIEVQPKQLPIPENTPDNRMRRKILSICHEMNWKKNGQLDWERINGWLDKYGYLHKPMNRYNHEELPRLVTQFEQLLKSYYADREK